MLRIASIMRCCSFISPWTTAASGAARAKSAALAISILLGCVAPGHAADGVITVQSRHSVKDTLDRFEQAAKGKGQIIFARVDHSAGAQKVGKILRPTEFLIFGNPLGGTPLMECAQTAGIDLPMKALAWQDAAGQVWLGYNDPQYLLQRHAARDCHAIAENLTKALAGLAQEAVK